jgi:hypothetical protein
MSGPYLKSGEFIILTTDRVSINTLQYEMLLTTRHLILVDIRYAQFLPQKIPLSTILSVKGGKIATGEPVITLSFSESGSIGDSGSMTFIFLQQPGEQRKRERDEWLKNIMGLIVSVRQETITTSLPASNVEPGIRPSVRRPVAPDKVPPYTTVVDKRPVPVELTIIPDDPESLVVPVEEKELPGLTILEEETKSEVAPKTHKYEESHLVSKKETGLTDAILSPEVKESIDTPPVQKNDAEFSDTAPDVLPAVQQVPGEPGTDSPAQKPFTFSLMEAVKTLFSPKEKGELPETDTTSIHNGEEPDAAQSVEPKPPEMISSPEKEEIVESIPVPEEKAELPDIVPFGISAAGEFSGTAEADSPGQKSFTLALQNAVKSLIASQEMRELPDTDTSSAPISEETESAPQEKPGSPDLPLSPEPEGTKPTIVFNKDSELSGAIIPDSGNIAELEQRPAGEATPQIPKSPLPSGGTGLPRHRVIAVLAIILLTIGILGGAVFYPQYFTKPEKEPGPAPTLPLQQISLLQTPVQQIPVPTTVQPTPVPTPAQQIPVPTTVVIPPAGVWVRVNYSGNYYGWVGNPGSLQGVTGSGDQIYKVRDGDGVVQVQIYTDDNTGNTLTVEIYRNGELITRRTRSIPMSSIELLIDAKTGNPPGVTSVIANETNQTGSSGGRVMYF